MLCLVMTHRRTVAITGHTTSSRIQSTKESPSSSSSCPLLIRCAMICGALGLLDTAGWLIYLGWAVAVSAIGPFAFLIWIEYVVVGLFWILGIVLIIEAIALIHAYTRLGAALPRGRVWARRYAALSTARRCRDRIQCTHT